MKLVFLCMALAACGGKIDTGDAGSPGGTDGGTTAKDAQPSMDVISPPPNPNCTPQMGSGTVNADGSCSTNLTWSCGTTKYTVDCSCPSTECSCTQQTTNMGGGGTTIKEPSMCPNCSGDLAAICGFPH